MQARVGRSVGFVLGSSAMVALICASILYLLPNAGAAVGGGAFAWTEGVAARGGPEVDNQSHLYVLDGWGGVHPVGASPILATTSSLPSKDIGFILPLLPHGAGGASSRRLG